jgi:hypothetical protein
MWRPSLASCILVAAVGARTEAGAMGAGRGRVSGAGAGGGMM